MNVWADDPWAEDATQPTKEHGTSLAQSNAVANAFEDDAGWGEFEGSGDNAWASDPWSPANAQVKEEEEAKGTDLGSESLSVTSEEEANQDDALESNENLMHESLGAAAPKDAHLKEEEATVQDELDELSLGPGSTIIPDKDNALLASDKPVEKIQVQKESEIVDGGSKLARPMSSSSETTETTEIISASSTRTSLDQGLPDVDQTVEDGIREEHSPKVEDEATQETQEVKAEGLETQEEDVKEEQVHEATTQATKNVKAKERTGPEFQVDLELINKLFTPRAERKEEVQTEEDQEYEADLIDSTSTRKMWYRLSRPLTLRGFLSGDSDDTYTRVTWPSSHIRKETVRIVSRWTGEDRMHGKTTLGAPLKSSFGWDESQPSNPSLADRRRSVTSTQPTPVSSRFPPSRQPSMTLHPSTSATSPGASFGWSTSPLSPNLSSKGHDTVPVSPASVNAENPWRRSIPSRPSSLQVSAASLDAVFAAENSKRQSMQLEPMSPIVASPAAMKKDLTIDIALASKSETVVAEDDDDEWGEMVQSPPPLDSPALAHPEPIVLKRRSVVKAVTPTDTQVQRDKRHSPTSPVASKQVLPEGPLSPARRAAFNAARVTRTLSSQHPSDEVSPQASATPFEDFTKVKLRKTSTAVQLEQPTALEPAQYPSPVLELAAPIGLPPPNTEPKPIQPTGTIFDVADSDDLSMFKSAHSGTVTFAVTTVNTIQPTLDTHEVQRVQSFLAQLPDMSYMLK